MHGIVKKETKLNDTYALHRQWKRKMGMGKEGSGPPNLHPLSNSDHQNYCDWYTLLKEIGKFDKSTLHQIWRIKCWQKSSNWRGKAVLFKFDEWNRFIKISLCKVFKYPNRTVKCLKKYCSIKTTKFNFCRNWTSIPCMVYISLTTVSTYLAHKTCI